MPPPLRYASVSTTSRCPTPSIRYHVGFSASWKNTGAPFESVTTPSRLELPQARHFIPSVSRIECRSSSCVCPRPCAERYHTKDGLPTQHCRFSTFTPSSLGGRRDGSTQVFPICHAGSAGPREPTGRSARDRERAPAQPVARRPATPRSCLFLDATKAAVDALTRTFQGALAERYPGELDQSEHDRDGGAACHGICRQPRGDGGGFPRSAISASPRTLLRVSCSSRRPIPRG